MSSVMIEGSDGGVIVNWNGEPLIVTCDHCISKKFVKVTYRDNYTEKLPCIFREKMNDVAIIRGNREHGKMAELAEEYVNTSVTLVHHHPRPFSQSCGKTYKNFTHTCGSYLGSSGSPLYNKKGQIMGIHESWDDETYARYLINCYTLREVLREFEITC